MNWNPIKIDLGTLRVRQETKVIYNYIGDDIPSFQQSSFVVTCGCSVPKWNPETKQLIVIFTPNPIPPHFLMQNKHSYQADKFVMVNYPDGRAEKLTFTATIIK